ncbi:nose resistant to fluoxetine protein 6-like [Helicoverpa zea]|uniref:nose resistant to fluoxetine protein 6-like n=1 Tax=Helicoverpa zea TaxID=7113 RepID=UPI001F56312B|nr:nose resistant to fluoxetine protein 6-like [Helicoverpa zea]
MFTKYIVLVVLLHTTAAVIYELNESDLARMPPLFHLDNYEECLQDPEGLYCMTETLLVSDEPSPLLTMIQEYAAHRPTHYNRTLLRHGICVTRTCKKFYENSKEDLRSALEACANESLYNNYKLRGRVLEGFDCSKPEKSKPLDNLEITVAGICAAILLVNIIASFCDYYFEKKTANGALRYLYCFSIYRNWEKLVAPATERKEPRPLGLKGLHGIRVINVLLTIGGHALILDLRFVENPEYIENLFMYKVLHILLNGTVIMQTFLMISSFLLVYHLMLASEKHTLSWKMLPQQILIRWLRLTLSYALALGLTVTWFGRLASGPNWQKMVGNEITDCRRNWWRHILYINNYYTDSECMVHAWYLAADLQLYCTALVVFLACRTPRARKVTLSLLFVAGAVIPAYHTYRQKLDGVLVVYPEFLVKIFMENPVFDYIYKRGHTNLIGYVVGMSMGYMVYAWQKAGGDPTSFRKYRYFYWTLFPMGCLCCLTGSLYYTHSPPPTLFIDVMFAAFMKPVFSIIIGTILVGVVIQFEDLYRPIVSWRGWTIPSRLSFSAYLLHIGFARNNVAAVTSVYRTSLWIMALCIVKVIIVSMIAAVIFCILVETPFNNVVKELIYGQKTDKKDKKETLVDKDEHIVEKSDKLTSKILDEVANDNGFIRKRLVRSS